MSETLTQEQKEQYLKASHRCPYCKSEDIERDFVEVNEGEATQRVTCNDCHQDWIDIYTLTDVQGEREQS
jgi:transposase-like protein